MPFAPSLQPAQKTTFSLIVPEEFGIAAVAAASVPSDKHNEASSKELKKLIKGKRSITNNVNRKILKLPFNNPSEDKPQEKALTNS